MVDSVGSKEGVIDEAVDFLQNIGEVRGWQRLMPLISDNTLDPCY